MLRVARRFVPLAAYPYRGNVGPCVLCGAHDATLVSRYDRRLKRLDTVLCEGCGLLRTDPMPTEAELAEYYRHHYRADYQLAGTTPPRRHLVRMRAEAGRRADLLEPHLPPGARVLDFGCGSGEFLAEGTRRGWRMEGVEPGAAYARHAAGLGLRVYGELPQAAGPFDAVTSHHVLEHLRDPAAALRRLVKVLAPGGLMYLAVPDMGPAPKPAFERLHFAHVHGFVPATLDLLAAGAGLVEDPLVTRNGTLAVYRRGQSALRPDPALAARVRAGLNQVEPLVHVVTLGWIAPTARRLARDVRDSFRRPG